MSTGAAERELLSTAAGSKVVLEPHHQYQADGPNSDGQDTTVQGLDAAAAHGVVERTPSSSPNSSHANTLPVHMSSSSSPPLQPGKGRVSGSPSAHQPQFEGGTQQSQQLQGQGSGLFQHKQPTATGDRQQSSPAASLPAAQSFQRGMQQLSATFEGPETGDDVYDAEEGSPQSEVGLELLGAMAAEIDSDKWEPAPGPVNPRSASAAAAAAAAGAQAAMAMLQARSEGAAGGQAGSFGSQPKSKAKSSNSAGAAANMSLVCQVPDCGVPLTGAHVSNYFRRHRVCVAHAKADVVSMHGKNYRFCQQCGVLHPIEDFDGQRKSCRVQLDKHNLRRRCRRKSHTYTKSSNSSYEQARGMGGMAMDPYGSFAQAYGMHPNMAWGAGMQAAAPKRGNAGWGRGVSEDTREMSRDRDEASNWMGDAADSAQHGGYMHAWGIGPGVPYDANGVYAAGMAAGAASLPPMMQQQQGAAMQGGAVGQDGWGMGAGGASAAAAAAGANGWTDGWAQAGASGPAAAAAAAGGYGAGDASYAAALAAAAAAANDYHPSGAAGAAAAAVGKGSRAKQEQPSTRPAQQRQGSNNPAGGALDPAAAAAMYMPESHSGELLDQAAPAAAAAAAAGLSPGNAATAAPGVRKHLVSSGGGSSNTSGSNGMGLQQLRLYIAAAIAAGKGPGLTGLRDLGFVQQLLIVDELAHGVLAEMQREQDSPQQQQQQATHLPEPTVHLATAGSAATPAASAPAAAPVAAVPVNPSRHSNSSVLSQEQQQQRLKGQLTYHQLPQQQHQQKASAPKMPSPQQQQQQAAKSSSPQKQDRQRSAAAAAGSGAGAAVAAAAGPGGVQLLPTNVPPAALAALMEQIAKYGAKPAAAAAAAAAPGSESAAAAVAAAAARQPGSNSQDVRGVKREPSSGSLALAQKRPRSAEPSQHLAAQGGNSNTQDLRQPGNTAAGGGGSNGGGYGGSNGGSNGAVRASPSSGASQQQQPPAGLCPPPSQQQQHRSSSPGVMQQLQQQLQGQLNSQGGGSVQVAQMLTQLLQQLTSGNGKAASPAPQQ